MYRSSIDLMYTYMFYVDICIDEYVLNANCCIFLNASLIDEYVSRGTLFVLCTADVVELIKSFVFKRIDLYFYFEVMFFILLLFCCWIFFYYLGCIIICIDNVLMLFTEGEELMYNVFISFLWIFCFLWFLFQRIYWYTIILFILWQTAVLYYWCSELNCQDWEQRISYFELDFMALKSDFVLIQDNFYCRYVNLYNSIGLFETGNFGGLQAHTDAIDVRESKGLQVVLWVKYLYIHR